MNIQKLLRGGQLRGHRTYIMSVAGIISAIASYLSGETDIFITMQTIFPLLGIFFLRISIKEQNQ
ncbi:MAG: hypothetical protein LBB23_02320 [Rickettsiales bacterium]|nr:hypothetical protein [Rickettsiales bacterium]